MPVRKKTGTARTNRRLSLNGRWTLEGRSASGERIEIPARVPGVVHWDLQRAGLIGDPFEGAVEENVQWVALQTWTYSLTFRAGSRMLSAKNVELVFEGLDTFAEISLNGIRIGGTDNMFVPHRFDISRALVAGDNTLVVTFLSPVEEGLKLHQEHNSVRLFEDGNPRPYVRKAQYSYGWDWGPKIAASGIWRDVYIEAWDAVRIESVYWRTLKAGPEGARVAVAVETLGAQRATAEATLSFGQKAYPVKLARRASAAGARFSGIIDIEKPQLWWPNGHGPQDLYDAQVVVRTEGIAVDRHSRQVGLRTVGLKREKDDEGEGFVITVNSKEIFCKGADWIPADIYLPRVSTRDYDEWVRMAAEGNMNMLRVWGGGIYEGRAFYEACDRYGVMVWQDFPFACALYPEDDWFLKNVEREATLAVKALRNHASIVLWCGNNENQWGQHSWWKAPRFSGKTIYDKLLPAVTRRYDPSRPYWPGSPYGGKDPNCQERGDRHNWDVWSGWKDYTGYFGDKGRFLSEFGWQAVPPMEAVAKFGPLKDLHPQHPLFERHNKQVEGGERLARFLAGSFKMPKDLKEYVYLTQVVQAEAIKAGVLHWRSRMMKTSGALYWQLNDCWPVVSWAAVDYARRPKALYYYSRRFFAPVAARVANLPEGVCAWVINDSPERVRGQVALQAVTFEGNEVGCIREDVDVSPNGVSKIGPLKPEVLGVKDPSEVFLAAVFRPANGEPIVDTGFILRPKHLRLPNPRLSWKVKGADGKVSVELSAKNFAYAVYLRLPGSDARFSDNFITILPRRKVEVRISGRKLNAAAVGRRLEVMWAKGGVPS